MGNPIEKVYFPDVPHGEKTELFPSLKQLFFTGNHVTEVSRFTGNHVTEVNMFTGNHVTQVSRFPGSHVTQMSRFTGSHVTGKQVHRQSCDRGE